MLITIFLKANQKAFADWPGEIFCKEEYVLKNETGNNCIVVENSKAADLTLGFEIEFKFVQFSNTIKTDFLNIRLMTETEDGLFLSFFYTVQQNGKSTLDMTAKWLAKKEIVQTLKIIDIDNEDLFKVFLRAKYIEKEYQILVNNKSLTIETGILNKEDAVLSLELICSDQGSPPEIKILKTLINTEILETILEEEQKEKDNEKEKGTEQINNAAKTNESEKQLNYNESVKDYNILPQFLISIILLSPLIFFVVKTKKRILK